MSYDRYRYIVLCEDDIHYRFILRFLKKKGVNTERKLELFKDYPKGKGDAKKHVAKWLPELKLEYPSVQNKGQTIYIIVRDADMEEYGAVYRKLDCDRFENIFLVIPKRNIETWLYFLINNASDSNDEKTDRKGNTEYNIKDCVNKLYNMTYVPDNAPQSFKSTFEQLKDRESKK